MQKKPAPTGSSLLFANGFLIAYSQILLYNRGGPIKFMGWVNPYWLFKNHLYVYCIYIFAYAKSIIRRDDKKGVDKDQGFIARKASPVIRILCV